MPKYINCYFSVTYGRGPGIGDNLSAQVECGLRTNLRHSQYQMHLSVGMVSLLEKHIQDN